MTTKTIKFNMPSVKINRKKSIKQPKTKVDMSKLRDTLQQKIQNRKSYITAQPQPPQSSTSSSKSLGSERRVVISDGTETSNTNNKPNTEINNEVDEFTESISFMNNKKTASKVTIKSRNISQNSIENIIKQPSSIKIPKIKPIPINTPNVFIPGCLKNSGKPTYNKSIKNRVSFKPDLISPQSITPHSIINNNNNNSVLFQDAIIISDTNTNTINTTDEPIIPVVNNQQNNVFSDCIDLNDTSDIIINLPQQTTTTTNTSSNNIDISHNNNNSNNIKEIKLDIGSINNITDSQNETKQQQSIQDVSNNNIPIISTIVSQMDKTIPGTTTLGEPIQTISKITTTNTTNNNNILNNNNLENDNDVGEINTLRTTTMKRFKVGKQNGTRKVAIFCKNKENIKEITKYTQEILNTNINQMKQYLINKTLLSVGSYAPNDVIKQMYVNSKLTGDIVNHNDDVLLNNYLTNSENNI
jgi:hypothetical protein